MNSLFEKAHARFSGMMPQEIKSLVAHLEREASDPWKILRLTIRISALCLFASLLITHDLWFQQGRLYAPAPLVTWFNDVPEQVNAAFYYIALAFSGILFVFPQARRIGLILPPIFVFFALQDQLRGQFFIYMYVFNLLIAGALSKKIDDTSLDPLRYMAIGVYFWAGIYKMNAYFFTSVFPQFVSPLVEIGAFSRYVGYVVPFIESAIGVFLLFPASRWLGQLFAFCMVTVVLLSIGPFGHNGAMTVWPTNVYIDSLAIFLFIGNKRPLFNFEWVKKPLSLVAILLFVLIPASGSAYLIGPQQSFKLFCCARYAAVEFSPKENLSFMPSDLERQVTGQHRLNSSTATFQLFQVCSGPVSASDKPFLDAFRGFCPHLKKPQEAKLYTGDVKNFMSLEVEERVYSLCTPEPKRIR